MSLEKEPFEYSDSEVFANLEDPAELTNHVSKDSNIGAGS
jgi:hypothetical protein